MKSQNKGLTAFLALLFGATTSLATYAFSSESAEATFLREIREIFWGLLLGVGFIWWGLFGSSRKEELRQLQEKLRKLEADSKKEEEK
jgi:hypothetical protein